jgi:RHS repeat-associated protein
VVVERGPRILRSPRQPARAAAWLAALVVVVGVAALGASSRAWATNVSGTISSNTTWTLANSPYVLTGSVTVASGVTLTIEPGVVVQGNATSRTLIVQGTLLADGTSGSPITFTSSADSAPGQWNGLRFDAGSGSSSLKWANVRYGGNGISEGNGMVDIRGGTVSIEDSTIRHSVVSGLVVSSTGDGSGMLVTVKRSKFESNGFSGSSKRGDGLRAFNARVVVEDSAFWSNAIDGIQVHVPTGYAPAASAISGSSMWNNERFGVYIFQDTGLEGLGADGNVAGKPGNAVYDNGDFTWGAGDFWYQMQVTRASGDVDWAGTYWGAVSVVPCPLASQRGHVSFATPFPDPQFALQIARGPVEYVAAQSGGDYCANDNVAVDAPAYQLPDLHFDAPPPISGGIALEQTYGTTECCLDDQQLATTADKAKQAYSPQPVNTASGSLSERASDLRLAGPGIPFTWSRQYNSRDTTSGALGPSWTHTYEVKLTVVNATTGELEYHAGSGQRTRFTKTNGGSSGTARYQGKGFDGTLRRLSNNTYELTTRDQRTLSFDSSGNLTQIKPRFRPATTLAYTSGKLSSITDSAGRSIAITYSAGNPTLIDRVTLPDARYVEYGYTSARLTSVRDARGKTWTIAYDGNGRLLSIQDPVGRYELQDVLYDSQDRVTSEENGSGDAITYAYTTSGEYELTTVTLPGRGSWVYKHRGYLLMSVLDPLNRTTSYTYDGQGRQSTVTDGRGNTRRFEHDVYGNLKREVAPSPLGYTVTRAFNATNDLVTETDGRGNPATYAYATGSDAASDYQVGQLKTVTDRENGVTTFKYWTTTSSPTPPSTNVGLLKSVTNPRTKTSSYDYDSSGNLTKITSPLGLKTTFGYDSSGRMTSMRDPRGNVPVPPAGFLTEWTYDAVDHVKTLTDARGHVTTLDYYDNELLWKQTRVDTGGTNRITSFEYDSDNRLWKVTDPRNGVQTRLYWADGLLKSVESAEARKTSYSYDNASQLTSVVEPNGNAAGATASDYTWTYGYDNAGNRSSEAHPDAGTTTITYDALDRPTQWTDPLSHTNSVTYDANDNVTQSTNGLNHSRTYTYDKLDRLKTETDERSKAWTYAYYSSGEVESLTSPLGNKTSYALDDDGRVASMVEPRGNATGATASDYTWTYEYDQAGNRTQVTDPLGNDLTYEFNAVNDVTKVTDQRSNETTYTYDVLNRLQKVTPPAAGATGTLETEYTYDAAGNLSSRTDPKGHTTSWAYDLDGLMTSRTTPVGVWNSTYDANGNVKTLEKPSGSSTQTAGDGTITYGYDRMSRPTSVNYSDSTPDVTRTYDLAGRPATMTDGAGGSVSYTHDNADRPTAIERTGGSAGLNGTLSYGYDNSGNITSRTYPDSTSFSQAFDDDSRLTSVASGGQTTSFGYDAADNLTSVTLPSGNGHVATRTFDRAGRLTTVENAKAGTILSKFLWTLDGAGNPTKAQATRGGTDTYDAFEYDARNRLAVSCYGVGSGATNCAGASNAISYAYDKVSNRTQEVRSGSVGNTGTIDYTYNNSDQLTSTTKGGTTTNYTYDTNGNQATAGTRTFVYDLADRRTSGTVGGTTTTYGHDGEDRRVSAVSGAGTDLRYVWDPLGDSGIAELALERSGAGALVRRYSGSPVGATAYTDGSGTFFYHRDPLDTVTDVSDASGTAQWRYEYEGYGAERSATNVSGSAPENRLRFTGQYLDANVTTYHLRARDYDPLTGRFLALDPLEGALDEPHVGAYVYVHGRPTVLIDPLGLLASSRPLTADHTTSSAPATTSEPMATADPCADPRKAAMRPTFDRKKFAKFLVCVELKLTPSCYKVVFRCAKRFPPTHVSNPLVARAYLIAFGGCVGLRCGRAAIPAIKQCWHWLK